MDERSEDADRLRSVNTVVVSAGRLVGHNTDAPGFDRFLRRDAGFEPAGRTAVLFGGGGAARACALALARAGLGHLTVKVREPDRTAAELARAVEGCATELEIVDFGGPAGGSVDLVVNATPLGARGEELPEAPIGPETLVVDLLYRPASTPLRVRAREAGATAFGGLGLLLHQAALSF